MYTSGFLLCLKTVACLSSLVSQKLRLLLQRKCQMQIELCARLSVLRLFLVGHVVQNRRSVLSFAWWQRMNNLLLRTCVGRTSDMKISRRCLTNYVKNCTKKSSARVAWLFFPHFSNSLIFHEKEQRKSLQWRFGYICDPNYHKIQWTFALNFSINALRSYIRHTRKGVSSDIQAIRSWWKKLGCASFFEPSSQCLGIL